MDPLNQQPETAEAYNNQGEVKRIKGDLDGALADYNKAIELKPEFAAAYNNRALVWGLRNLSMQSIKTEFFVASSNSSIFP
jgi:tetratricopeptide (TPR) repeat protein